MEARLVRIPHYETKNTQMSLTEPKPRLIRLRGTDVFPRVSRYPNELPLAMLKEDDNLLLVNRDLFELLSKEDQESVLRTNKTFLFAEII
jgi:hypothetical protein